MRFVLFITLILSLAVSPAFALASCAKMSGTVGAATEMADASPHMNMAGMNTDDCESMGVGSPQSHDNGCAAACALACPGFYNGPNSIDDHAVAFHSVRYAIPVAGPGPATPSHLDPPPPRA